MSEEETSDLLSLETSSLRDDVAIVHLTGEVDISSVHVLRNGLASMIGTGLSAVILDASGVTFMDSTGLHALVEAKRSLHDNGMRIFLVPSRQVRRVLELVFPDPVVASRLDSVEAAIQALDGSNPAGVAG